ncbi:MULTISPECIES: LamG domain-containing protein [Flavobacterium]|uniref:LamG domain-containing protein n=1 Tax=Flavobacterium TaxID=237 RepID=UPI001FCB6641|nr:MULTISPECIES: LamG domain-containing protein [Flavobacterium]UOK42894.1 T9SS type A sorting domain-containing protein [Flavobacterium enshiense]
MKKNYFLLSLLTLGITALKAQVPNYVPSSGLVAYYGFNGNANDATANNYHLTNYGASLTTDRNGTANSAYSFNGSTSYLMLSSFPTVFSYTGAHSVSFWMKKNNTAISIAIMSGSTANGNFIWNVQSTDTATQTGVNKQGSSWAWAYGPAVTVGQWEHYTAVYNNQNLTLYKNGVSVGTRTADSYTSVNSAPLPLWIGKGPSGGNFNGSLDDVAIWNRALTPAEVTQVYQATLSTNEVSQKKSFRIYPNPASEAIYIQNDNTTETINYQLSDINGKIVLAGAKNSSELNMLNIKNLVPGIYFLKLNNEESEKIIIK